MTSSQDNLFYLTALKATEEIEEPAIGLSQSTGKAAGISESNRVLIRQNNTIIELYVRLSNQVSQLEARIRSLEANKQAERGITPDLVSKLEKLTLGPDLVSKLEKLTLGPKEKSNDFYQDIDNSYIRDKRRLNNRTSILIIVINDKRLLSRYRQLLYSR